MRLRIVLPKIAAILAGIILFILLTIIFIPSSAIFDAASGALANKGYTLTASNVRKAYLLGIKGSGVTLSSEHGELLKFDKCVINMELLPLIIGRVNLDIKGAIGEGEINGTVSYRKSPAYEFYFKNIPLEMVPFFKNVMGASVKGVLKGKADIKGAGEKSNGVIRIEAQNVDLKGLKFGVMPIPDAFYQTVQGSLKIQNGSANLESFSFQGDGIYIRIKGNILLSSNAPLNLTMELMPKPEFIQKQNLIFLLMSKYNDTPGHYSLPIRGTLTNPSIQ
ncbi:MAG: type II secretion system protein GspN [Desulfuromonadales bacterium]|nr:type II secretion system protein GspN [Desulfuromonadales bacterium]